MRILWHNLWDLYSLTESQEDANYPAENTQDIRLTKIWRTNNNTTTTISIDAGTGEIITANCAAIIGINQNTATYQIQGDNDSDFSSLSVDATFTWRNGILIVFFDSWSGQYWRFRFTEPAEMSPYYEVDRLFLGEYLQVDPSSLVEFPQEQVRTDNVQFSRDGQLYADEGICYKQLRYQFQEASASAKTLIETMWAGSAGVGKHKPIILLNYDETFTVIEPLYCAIAEDIVFKHKTHDYWDWDLVLRECR